MDYRQTLAYLYNSAPLFQQVGSKAYKEGMENTWELDAYFSHPHRSFRSIHIAGTNGKGSCSHTLAAILQSAGYRVGLYTSPHLLDFRERIRVNGQPVSEAYVVEFVEKHRTFFEPLHPSFFELTTAMAFRYFADEKIDVAVVEVGLGGRLDCTNIIAPDLSIITNISLDHTQLLGHTPQQIASEKAGIIKPAVPVVVGEATSETRPVFLDQAAKVGAPIIFAEDEHLLLDSFVDEQGNLIYNTVDYSHLEGELRGIYQIKNTNTLLSALRQLKAKGYAIQDEHVRRGFLMVSELTGLMGRWQKLQDAPLLICDTGHNVAGMEFITAQLTQTPHRKLHFIIGMVDDKDIDGVLALLPKDAVYYFTKATIARALSEGELKHKAMAFGLHGDAYPDVVAAMRAAQKNSLPEDMIFAGGSTFIVADLLAGGDALNLH